MITAIPQLYVPEWRIETADAIRASPRIWSPLVIEPDAAGAVLSLFSLLAAAAVAGWLRKRPLRPHPYWTTPALARPALLGIVLGALTTGWFCLSRFAKASPGSTRAGPSAASAGAFGLYI